MLPSYQSCDLCHWIFIIMLVNVKLCQFEMTAQFLYCIPEAWNHYSFWFSGWRWCFARLDKGLLCLYCWGPLIYVIRYIIMYCTVSFPQKLVSWCELYRQKAILQLNLKVCDMVSLRICFTIYFQISVF